MYLFQGMQYNTIHFLVFLAFFYSMYFLVPKNGMKVTAIILGNLVFYFYVGGVGALTVVTFTALVVYLFSLIIDGVYKKAEQSKPQNMSLKQELLYWNPVKKKTRWVTTLAVCLILGVLIYVKIGKLVNWEAVDSLWDFSVGKILVPLGLSYYTFSSVGYLIDIYKRKICCTRNFFYLFACVTFFPIIVEGPISRYEKLIKQFSKLPKFCYEQFCRGLQLFLWGLLKKIVIADRISVFSATIFSDIGEYAGVEIVLALIFNMFSMYTDFSGCMDMVTGVSEAMGVELEPNFKQPFLAENVPEFWRRWHMTLCGWFRDYIYMPIARSSFSKKLNKKVRNRFDKHISETLTMAIPMFVVWMVTGLWHGTGKAYIVWGLYWGGLMFFSMMLTPYIELLNKKCRFQTKTFAWKIFRIVRTDLLYCIASALATVGSSYGLRQVLTMFQRIGYEHRLWTLFDGEIFEYGMTAGDFSVAILAIGLLLFVDIYNEKGIVLRDKIAKQPLIFRWLVWLALIVFIMVWGKYGNGYDASMFIYKEF